MPDLFPETLPRPKPRKRISARIILPDYAGVPTSDQALADAELARDRKLQAYKEACAAARKRHPPLPYKWSNWKQAAEIEKRRSDETAGALRALTAARQEVRDVLCARALAGGQ